MHNNIRKENGIEITSVEDYISTVLSLKDSVDNNASIFYRGQAADFWDIRPSVYRDNMLSIEHELLSEPLRVLPEEFKNLGDTFEIMEKYQHYGLPTRLLDLTSNPLVALFFACEPYTKEEEYISEDGEPEKHFPNGIIYFLKTENARKYNDKIVRIVSYISKKDLSEETSIKDVINELNNEGIIDDEFKDSAGIKRLIDLLQEAYIVLPVVNNARLMRQSGAFMLPGRFNFKLKDGDKQEAIIEKAECDLRTEFEESFFFIDNDNKKRIREELEIFGISEATLFPELEYQLKDIQYKSGYNKQGVARFEKYADVYLEKSDSQINDKEIDDDKIIDVVDKYLAGYDEKNKVISIIKNNKEIDWYKRENILSRIKISIRKLLQDNDFGESESRVIAESIVYDLVS